MEESLAENNAGEEENLNYKEQLKDLLRNMYRINFV